MDSEEKNILIIIMKFEIGKKNVFIRSQKGKSFWKNSKASDFVIFPQEQFKKMKSYYIYFFLVFLKTLMLSLSTFQRVDASVRLITVICNQS